MRVQDRVCIEGEIQGQITVPAAGSAMSLPLVKGMYAVWADSGDVYIKVARTHQIGNPAALAIAPDRAQDVNASSGYIIKAGNVEQVDINMGRQLGAFSTPGTTVRYHRIGD